MYRQTEQGTPLDFILKTVGVFWDPLIGGYTST